MFAALHSYSLLMTWCFVRSLIPYAVSHTSNAPHDNTETEQYVISLSYLAIATGSSSAMVLKIDNNIWFIWIAICYTLLVILFCLIAFNQDGFWIFEGSNELIVIIVCLMRLIDGYLPPIIYEGIDKLYPETSQKMNQWIGAIGVFGLFFATWITYTLVEMGVLS